MFDKLVVSSRSQGRGRAYGFLLGTGAVYITLLAFALALSVYTVAPQLADDESPGKALPLTLPRATREASRPARGPAAQASSRPSIYNPMKLSNILAADPDSRKPVAWSDRLPISGAVTDIGTGGSGAGAPGGIDGLPGYHGAGDGGASGDGPPPPLPQKAEVKPPERDSRVPLKVTSTVLQGKALDRRTPAYPALARQIRLEGAVAVEVVISPEGRVESWRAISGPPLLVPAAVEAARQWRFAPTLLNGTAVRVTGIITFVFRL
ncbi:MAG TPA: energy transducer TonB [Blastocatellia bacterium]|nr:energy transducer TonB [Blastocatellia bacterium]